MKSGIILSIFLSVVVAVPALWAEDSWPQFKFDPGHCGNAPGRTVSPPLKLVGAVPLTDAIFTAPAVSNGRVFVVDGSGTLFCFNSQTLHVIWKVKTRGGKLNCSNVSSPAVAGDYVHFGTTAGSYYVIRAKDGTIVKEIRPGDPIFCAPVVGNGRVYFVTLGSSVYALSYDGHVYWTWSYVKDQLHFTGNKWSGKDWSKRGNRVTWRDQFCCSKNFVLSGKTLIVPAGGPLIWLEDEGDRPLLTHIYNTPRENPTTLGLSVDSEGTVYRQWLRRDNGGRVEILKIENGKIKDNYVHGTQTSYAGAGSLSFSSVSIRGEDVYRCRPEKGFGFCRHRRGAPAEYLGGYPSIAAPVLAGANGIYGGLDGCLYVVPLKGNKKPWSFKTAFGKPISAPVAISGGRIYFGCEDGYLYVLGPEGGAKLPEKDLCLDKIRSPLTGARKDPEYNLFTSFGNNANTNTNHQGLKPPFKIHWIRRFKGSVKHFSVFGGGRMYTHTAEGQIFAVEQETGRLLWRTYYPGVHVSFTSPLYYKERLYVPQAGFEKCFVRCINAADGHLVWQAPFTGSPSWNRQQPPIIYKGLAFYIFSSGKYTPAHWLFEHQSTFGFPKDQKPLIRAWDIKTGKEVWTRDFSRYGSGGDDAGMCLLKGTLYYSCYFGNKKPGGVTAAIEPMTGRIKWTDTKHTLHAGCTISGRDGRLYLGGYNAVDGKNNYIWCLNAEDGSLIWKSDPVKRAIHVVTIRDKTLFTHAQYKESYLLDRFTGKILKTFRKGYRCTRFTVSEPYLLGPNLDIYDLSQDFKLISTGPAIDVLICVGAQASNGRIFYTTNGAGLQASMWCGDEATDPVWEQ